MINVSYIEKRCRQFNLEELPALNQLRLAQQRNDLKTVERIASNIAEFIKETFNVSISTVGSEPPLERKSQPPSRRTFHI